MMPGRDAPVGKDVECCNHQPHLAEPSGGANVVHEMGAAYGEVNFDPHLWG